MVQIPSGIFSKFLHDDSMVKILSSPKVRAFTAFLREVLQSHARVNVKHPVAIRKNRKVR